MKKPFGPDMGKLLDDHSRGALMNVFKALPGRVFSYDTELTTAQVEVMLKYRENGGVNEYPQLLDVPVFQLTGGDGGVTLPVVKGDPCLVVFADRDIDNWFATGGAEVPSSERIHSLADGFAFVGFRPQTDRADRPDPEAVGLYRDGTQISIKNNKAAIRNPSTDLLTKFNALVTAVNSAISGAQVIVTGGSSAGTYSVTNSAPASVDFTDLLYQGDEL